MGGFIPCIQMDAYPYEHSPKRKVVPAPYFQLLQAVVVQYAVVDTLTGCTFAVYFLVFFGISWNLWLEEEVAMILYVDGASIFSGGTFSGMGQKSMRPHFSGQRYLCASFMGSLPHGHILCPPVQKGCPVLSKVMSAGAFSDDFALPLMSIRALISHRSKSS